MSQKAGVVIAIIFYSEIKYDNGVARDCCQPIKITNANETYM